MSDGPRNVPRPLPSPRPGTGPRPLPAPRALPVPRPLPVGPPTPRPPSPLPPSLRPERLGTFRGREVPKDAEPDLHEQIAFARSQIARVAAGEFSHRRAPTILKASIALLDEALGKLVEKSEVKGAITLSAAVAEAAQKIEEQRLLPSPREAGPDAA